MKEKDSIVKKVKTIWSATLCGDELPSATIRSDYNVARESSPQIFTSEKFEENATIVAGDNIKALEEQKTILGGSESPVEQQTILGESEDPYREQATILSDGASDKKDQTMVEETQSLDKVDVDFDDFEVVGELGRGGMGIVYLARQKSLNREIALKVISTNQNHGEMQKRFISEAIVTADLDHPNIVPIHTLSEDKNGQISIAMKKVNGTSWKELLHPQTVQEKERSAKMEIFDHLDVLCRVCDAVAYAHSHNIIHRDLKPENIMIGGFGEVLVMDWGIALDISENKTEKTLHRSEIKAPEGTPLYMAPEMALNDSENIGVATDVYLCGAILHEIIHGAPPHHGKTIMEILCNAAQGEISPSSSSYSELDKVLYKALAHNPEDRFASVLDFKEALLQFSRHYDASKIIDTAMNELQDLQQKENLTNQDVYITGDEIYNSFVQALKIQDNNPTAINGIVQIIKLQSQWALKHEDSGMIELYIGRLNMLKDTPVEELEKMKKRLETLRGFRKNIVYTLVLVVLIIGIVFWGKMSVEEDVYLDGLQAEYDKKTKEAADAMDFAQKKNTAQSVIEMSQKIRKINDELEEIAAKSSKIEKTPNLDLGELRYNIIYQSLQMGHYQDALLLIKEELRFVKSPVVAIDKFIEKENIKIDKGVLSLFAQKDIRTVYHSLCSLARSTAYSGEILERIWRHCCTVSDDAMEKRLQEVAAVALLGISVQAHNMYDKRTALRDAQRALAIDLPVHLWSLATANTKSESRKSSLRLEKRQKRIWGIDSHREKFWNFPPQNLQLTLCNFLFFSEQQHIYTGSKNSLIVLNSSDGTILYRYRLPHPIKYLYHLDKNSFAVEMLISEYSIKETYRVIFDVQKQQFRTPLKIYGEGLVSLLSSTIEANQVFKNAGFKVLATDIAQNVWPQSEKERANFEKLIATSMALDQTNIYYRFVKAMILSHRKQQKEAQQLIEEIATQKRINFNEYVLLGLYCNYYGFPEWEKMFYEKAQYLQTKTFHNPHCDVFIPSSTNIFLKKLAQHYFDKGRTQNDDKYIDKTFALLNISREIFHYTEGDHYSYLSLSKWAADNNRPQLAQDFSQFSAEALYQGGDMLSSSSDLALADFLIFFNGFLSLLILSLLIYTWYRARASRISDLEAIGYDTYFLRNMAFLANPFKRARYTFITYLNKGERVCLCCFALLFMTGTLMLTTIVSDTGKMASIPLSLGNGYLGGKEAYSYLKKFEGKVDEKLWKLLMAEAEFQKGSGLATFYWQSMDHPIARNNMGVFYSTSDVAVAKSYFEKNKDLPDIYGKIAQINLAILNKKSFTDLATQLPKIYQNHLRFFPQRCLMAFCPYSMLISVQTGEESFIRKGIKAIFFGGGNSGGLIFELSGNDSTLMTPFLLCHLFVESLVKLHWFPIIVMILALIGLLSSERSLHKEEPQQIKKIVLYLGNIFPGWVWLVSRNGLQCMMYFLLTIVSLCGLLLDYFDGGILTSIAFPSLPFVDSVEYLQPWYLTIYSTMSAVILVVLVALSIRKAVSKK
ncbi:serine/threonine-protein kinase [Candidatus Uabimicrobium amorphum]|uniref:Serine/threonine protein kinase n=1 Tax=Uabimicrobium amorphum TaxID=2596890 RepID=A0A5S9F4N2_UABAM|nr:protein kinase [Candidatus Uabimicrobium amorphum]BBM85742.1 serine/threonine protein kinase [Candidatus Uabimicrobium amorphum]